MSGHDLSNLSLLEIKARLEKGDLSASQLMESTLDRIHATHEALNAVVRVSSDPVGFDEVQLADALLTANLFGRATNNLLVAQRLQVAYAELDRELKQVAEIQRSLLPPRLPDIPGLDLAVSYKTAARAGGSS